MENSFLTNGWILVKRVLFASQGFGQEGRWGEPASYRSIIIITKNRVFFKKGLLVPSPRHRRGGDENPPHPSPAQCWAPRPSPRLRHPAPRFRMSLDGMSGSRVQDDGGLGGGGVWGEGCRQQCQGNYPGLLIQKPPPPQPYPLPPKVAATVRPHIRGGGPLLGGKGVGLGWGAAKPPKPLPPPVLPCCVLRPLFVVEPGKQDGWGWGCVIGGF